MARRILRSVSSFGQCLDLHFCFLLLINAISFTNPVWVDHETCFGTENGMAQTSDAGQLINKLREMYSNCTHVHGNLEISGITLNDLKKEGLESLDFFDNIEEVAGYVLIAYTVLPRISFSRLKIIWGDRTFTAGGKLRLENFSFLVISSGVDQLDLNSLRSIGEGRVGFFNATGLCHWKKKSIDWNQILDFNQNRLALNTIQNDTCFEDADSGTCSSDCKYCWGPKPEQCQKIYRTGCAPQCRTHMCFNVSSLDYCCSAECAAGCSGPTNKECYGCKAMRDNGVCVDKCPSIESYNMKTLEYTHNPDGKYAWNRDCVKTCPSHMFVYREGCVARCPSGYYAKSNETECKRCDGPCPKTCVVDKPLSSMNSHEFINCTVIEGHLTIRQDTLNGGTLFDRYGGDDQTKFEGLRIEDLEVLSDVERITHYLFVQSETLTTLKFLRNLKQIDGRKKFSERYSFYITSSNDLGDLGLSSLTKILDGEVYLAENSHLCYVYTLPWENITGPQRYRLFKNRHRDICEEEGRVCHESCEPTSGCWGPGPDMCFSCRHFKWNQTCVQECNASENLFPNGKRCESCHDECIGCKGPGPKKCIKCKHVQLDTTCVEKCPEESHYELIAEKRCTACHPNCFKHGCTGPGNFVGIGGCKKCSFAVIDSDSGNVSSCLPELSNAVDCRSYPGLENYFWIAQTSHYIGWRSLTENACLKCHDACKTCVSIGDDEIAHKCECKKWRFRKPGFSSTTCVLQCPSHTYNQSDNCFFCHRNCERCYGPESSQCYKCKGFVDYVDESKTLFNCVERCPKERSYISNDTICTDIDDRALAAKKRQTQVISGVVVAAIFLALIIVCTVCFVWRRRIRALKYLSPPDEYFEMNPDAKPNLARLRLILETQLKKGQILGYGAFGTVFRGVWIPDEKKTKVVVAIKVLHESNSAAQKEMLDEAGIMCSMENQYLAQLIGVCVGQQLMLVTPLFPLGNLLEYVQSNRAKVGSLALLRWCTQIANGMAYLEERRLVHRDLAARNVLVQTPYHVRITDFGLAKMLEYGQEELKIYEGKMPIKWLALECIQYRLYTHKSDVWAYGVTVWEILTFGDKPYKDVSLHQIPSLLERGERLQQPKICSLDIYMILIQCWMVDANTRLTFTELAEKFCNMMKDPGRYLAIEGDALLRLPSYSSTDRRQMLDQFTEDDDDEDLQEAVDFFHQSQSSQVTPTSPFAKPFFRTSVDTDPGAIAPHMVQEVAARIRPGNRQQSTSSHRYASDPVKKTRFHPNVDKPAVAFEPVATDVDNYLVPDSQQRTSSSPSDPSEIPLSGSKSSLKYTPVIADSAPEGDIGLDYYEYLKTAVSGSRDNDLCLENREYMMPNNNLINRSEEELRDTLIDPERLVLKETHQLAEAETVV